MILPHRVPYLFLARTFAEISQHSARTKILGFLVNSMIPPMFLEVNDSLFSPLVFRSIIALSPNDLLPAIYLTINKVCSTLPPPSSAR